MKYRNHICHNWQRNGDIPDTLKYYITVLLNWQRNGDIPDTLKNYSIIELTEEWRYSWHIKILQYYWIDRGMEIFIKILQYYSSVANFWLFSVIKKQKIQNIIMIEWRLYMV
jgi:hypothetical protein